MKRRLIKNLQVTNSSQKRVLEAFVLLKEERLDYSKYYPEK